MEEKDRTLGLRSVVSISVGLWDREPEVLVWYLSGRW